MAEHRSPIASDKLIAQLSTPEKGQRIYYDGALPGFGVRVTSAGAKTFVLNYRVRGTGKERRYSIGSTAHWKVVAARKEAEQLRKIIDLGGDPLGDIEQTRRQADQERLRSKTVDQLCDRFEAELLPSLRPATQKFYKLAMKNHIRPALGRKRVDEVTKEHIEEIHERLTERGQRHQANQCVVLAGGLFKRAIQWGWRSGENPARDVDKHTLEGRERYLSPAELKRLSDAVEGLQDRQAAAIIKILIYTGARVGETLRMRWQDIDFQRGVWIKPSAATKQKRIHRLPLAIPVISLLKTLKEEQDAAYSSLAAHLASAGRPEPNRPPWVFPGRGKAGHRTDLRLPWETALKAAKLSDLRIHDLRHSLASTLVGAGYSLPMIGAALGHTRTETTARYAHLADDPLRTAMTAVADIIDMVAHTEGKASNNEESPSDPA